MESYQNLTQLLDKLNLEQAKKAEKVQELKETKVGLESKLNEIQKRKEGLSIELSNVMKEGLLLDKDTSSLSSKTQSLTNDTNGLIKTKIMEAEHVETELESNKQLLQYFKEFNNNFCEKDTSGYLESVFLAESFGVASSQLGSLTRVRQTIEQVDQQPSDEDDLSLSKLRDELEQSKAELERIVKEKLRYEEACEMNSKLINERKAIMSKHLVTQRIKEKKLLAQKIRLERLLQQGKKKEPASN